MLYDPKWKETKTDPFATSNLIAWLETQPSDGEYCFLSNGECMFGQYFTQCGFRDVSVGGFSVTVNECRPNEQEYRLPDGWDDVAAERPHTFGSALDRARALTKG